MSRIGRLLGAIVLAIGVIAAAGAPLNGTFALQNGSAKTHAFLTASSGGNALDQRLAIWMTATNGGVPIRRYTVDMTKLLHVIIVSDDFKEFLHVHPVLGGDGRFTIDQPFPTPALYHVYADGDPQGVGQQVFRFDLPVGGGGPAGARALARTGPTVVAGPYTVKLSGTTLHTGNEAQLAVHITRNGKPARDLHPYLGALAHAVFLNGADLTYVHVHPMQLNSRMSMPDMPGMKMSDMSGMKMSDMSGMSDMDMKPLSDSAISAPDMLLHVELRESGTYKLWLQFRGGTSLFVAPFVITAR